MHRRFRGPRQRLAELVAGHEQPLAKGSTGLMKCCLLRIGLVIAQPIRVLPAPDLHRQFHPLPKQQGKA